MPSETACCTITYMPNFRALNERFETIFGLAPIRTSTRKYTRHAFRCCVAVTLQ
jgi:hypothetical protein